MHDALTPQSAQVLAELKASSTPSSAAAPDQESVSNAVMGR